MTAATAITTGVGAGPKRRDVLKGLGVAFTGSLLPRLAGPAVLGASAVAPVAAAATSYGVQVTDAKTAIADKREHCSTDVDRLAPVHCALGQQVRVVRSDSEYALYTVGETPKESPDTVVRMGSGARGRLKAPTEFDAVVDSRVTHPTYSDDEAKANSEFVERLMDDGSHKGFVVCAPHGGMIERYTDDQAERVASILAGKGKAVSSWICKGWKSGGGAYDRWHISSTDVHRASFPKLDSIADRGFAHAVSFHGIAGNDGTVLIGGRASDSLKNEIKREIQKRAKGLDVRVVTSGPYAATSERNFVNWLTANDSNGVQIEQSSDVRANHSAAIADAVASVYQRKL